MYGVDHYPEMYIAPWKQGLPESVLGSIFTESPKNWDAVQWATAGAGALVLGAVVLAVVKPRTVVIKRNRGGARSNRLRRWGSK